MRSAGKIVTEHGLRIQTIAGSWVMDVSLLQAINAFLLSPILCSFYLHKYQLLSFEYVSPNAFLWASVFKFLIFTSDLERDLSIWKPITFFQQDCLMNILPLPINTALIFSKVPVEIKLSAFAYSANAPEDPYFWQTPFHNATYQSNLIE